MNDKYYFLQRLLFFLEKREIDMVSAAEQINALKYDEDFPELNEIYELLDSKAEFLKTIERISGSISPAKSENIKELIAQEWAMTSLLKIVDKEEIPYQNKLEKISLLWEDAGYPKEWKSFIYYMPAEMVKSESHLVLLSSSFAKNKMKELENIKRIIVDQENNDKNTGGRFNAHESETSCGTELIMERGGG